MGYVFDAMNRSDDDPRPEKDMVSNESQTPNEPVAVPEVGPRAEDAAPPTEPVEQTPQVEASDTSWQPEAEEEDAPVYNFSAARAEQESTISSADIYSAEHQENTTANATLRPRLRLSSEWLQSIDDRLVSLTEPSSQLAEEYRGIRTTLLARWEHRRHLVHTITSATPQEGKTITSLNLGLSLAELRNRKTIVIEADLRLPTFNKLLHLNESKGMIEYLRGQVSLNEVITKLEGTALHIIKAGSRASNDAVQLLSNNRMTKLLEKLRTKYDHIIIDTPPVIELADAGILGGLSDEVMLIARISRTPKPLIEQALRALRSYNAPVAGVIATDQDRGRNRYHYYRYGYRYRYRYYAKRAA